MKQKKQVGIQVVFIPAMAQHYLLITTAGWFNYVEISEIDAEKTSRLHEIEIQKRIAL